MRDAAVIERPADQRSITRRYTEEATTFIGKHAARAVPSLSRSHDAARATLRLAASSPGAARAVSTGMSWRKSTGALDRSWTRYGSSGSTSVRLWSSSATTDRGRSSTSRADPPVPFRGEQGRSMEGGMRVPAIFWGPGIVRPGVISGHWAARWTWCRRLCTLTGARAPRIARSTATTCQPVLRQTARSPRETMFFYRGSPAVHAAAGAVQGALLHAAGVRQRGREGARSSLAVQHRPGSWRAVRYRCETSGSHRADSDDRLGPCAHDRAR